MWQGYMTTDGHSESLSGNPEKRKDHEEGKRGDSATTSRKSKAAVGPEAPEKEKDGGLMRRAKSCNGWTEPRIVK